ncbi:hypothetical protein [Amycolatopsis sp. NPDC098790]|uniref:hypothetical protein n=1 Tax=Amycolatopsis sp. NPDC098790 TaxID=3363939 RepID=UPI003830F2BB
MKKRTVGSTIAIVLALTAIGYLVGVAVAALIGSEEPWAHGLFGIGPALAGYYADTLRRRIRG